MIDELLLLWYHYAQEETRFMQDKNRQMAQCIAEKVASQGGRVYYVGGLVRDKLLGIDNKDVDVELHGVTPEALQIILSRLGE
ncbi:MAG: hypothetical protein ACI4U2_04860, partial [Christensenellaceae bacterium]